jgi:flagellar biosynthesis protein FlhG
MTQRRGPTVVAVAGGKGGAGKSVVAANLSVALAQIGFRTTLVDADLGAANQHTLFGIDRPGLTLQALLDGRARSLDEVTIGTGIPRLGLVPGMAAIPGAANLAHARKLKLLRHLRRLDADVVVVDVGAGTSYNATDFFEAGDLRLVVSTPQLVSVQNAYAFLKAALFRAMRALAASAEARAALEALDRRRSAERVRDVLAELRYADPALAARVAAYQEAFGGLLVGNCLERSTDRSVFFALARMTRDFLNIDVPVVATVPLDARVHASVTRRVPLLSARMVDAALRSPFDALAERVAVLDVESLRARRAAAGEADIADEGATEPEPEALEASLGRFLRRAERVRVDWACAVSTGHGDELAELTAGTLVDLSVGGARVRVGLDLVAGDRVRLVLRGLGVPALAGTVRHAAHGEVGVEFDESCRDVVRGLLASWTKRIAGSGAAASTARDHDRVGGDGQPCEWASPFSEALARA